MHPHILASDMSVADAVLSTVGMPHDKSPACTLYNVRSNNHFSVDVKRLVLVRVSFFCAAKAKCVLLLKETLSMLFGLKNRKAISKRKANAMFQYSLNCTQSLLR